MTEVLPHDANLRCHFYFYSQIHSCSVPRLPANDDDSKKARKSSPAKAPGDYSAQLVISLIGWKG